jgi:hypothetical protein
MLTLARAFIFGALLSSPPVAGSEPPSGTAPATAQGAPATSAFATTSAAPSPADEAYAPHTPILIFYLTGPLGHADAEAIRSAVATLPSARTLTVDDARCYARLRFDSHVISYHQVAQAIVDAGTSLGRRYDPRLVLRVPGYALDGHAAQVDAIFAGKKLDQRVSITMLDRRQGLFSIGFRTLIRDPGATAPQGFNGGHLHHPLHDPPPRGLGLDCDYLSADDPRIAPGGKTLAGSSQPATAAALR